MKVETEIRRHLWPADGLHAALARAILSREAVEPGIRVSNVGGWHSAPGLLEWTDVDVTLLTERIRVGAGAVGAADLRCHAWANVMREGAHHIAHRHGDAIWSGVYYIDAGNGGGAIAFARGLEALRIAPQTGLMLLFPGDLLHSVAVYGGSAPRISVGFNLF